MLNTLRFNLTLPTPYNFLARFLKAAGAHLDKEVRRSLSLGPAPSAPPPAQSRLWACWIQAHASAVPARIC